MRHRGVCTQNQQVKQGPQAILFVGAAQNANVTSVYEEASEEPDDGIGFVVNAPVNGKPVRLGTAYVITPNGPRSSTAPFGRTSRR